MLESCFANRSPAWQKGTGVTASDTPLPGTGGSAMRCLWLVNISVESSSDLSSRSDSGIGAQPPKRETQAVFEAIAEETCLPTVTAAWEYTAQ